MRKIEKSISDVTVRDIMRYPVWEYMYDDEHTPDDSSVRPVRKAPVNSLENRVIGDCPLLLLLLMLPVHFREMPAQQLDEIFIGKFRIICQPSPEHERVPALL